jgi:hypothetical protein
VSGFKTEEELAGRVVGWLQAQRWETFHEVQMASYGRRADIVARCGPHLWVVETKRSLTFDVIEQALKWHSWADLVSVAVPSAKRSGMAARFCEFLGVGLIVVPKENYSHPQDVVAPRLQRMHGRISKRHDWLERALTEEHKASAPGNARSEYYTPFRRTCQELKSIVDKNQGGIAMSAAIKSIPHHYASDKSAICSLTKWIREGKVDGIDIDPESYRLVLLPKAK